MVSALVPYKRLDIAIRAATRLGAPLRIIGTGPERDRLARLAGPTVEFLGSPASEAVREAYRGAIALVLPAAEDFGIAPIEALACGTPVVALADGGVSESVTDALTGCLVSEATPEAFMAAMTRAESVEWDRAHLRSVAEGFGTDRFETSCRGVIDGLVTSDIRC